MTEIMERTPARTPTLSDRRETLRHLARNWGNSGSAVREIMLRAVVHASMNDRGTCPGCTCGTCTTCTWGAYLHDLSLADGIECEIWAQLCTWEDINPELDCADRDGEAREEIWQRVAGHEDLLLRGAGAQ